MSEYSKNRVAAVMVFLVVSAIGAAIFFYLWSTTKEPEVETVEKAVGYAVRIANNPRLPTCQAEEVMDQILEGGFDGEVCIHYNLIDDCEDDTSGC